MIDGGQRIGHRQFTIIMTVDTNGNFQFFSNSFDCFGDVFRQASTVRVTEDDRTGSCILSGDDRLQSKLGVGSKPIEEMFGVIEDFSAFSLQECD